MKPEDVSPVASAALTRAFDAGQVDFRKCSHYGDDVARITFRTEEDFQAWFLAEMRQVRERVAEQILGERAEREQRTPDGRPIAPPSTPEGVRIRMERRKQAERDAQIARGQA
ncbi:hypothetical protein [Actinomadura sp. GTD37]|uniref:hypothetical protein n=1 Tax=Actinomadura sp. GTD37 TaxID=1778030 RepID=UPI0035BF5C57